MLGIRTKKIKSEDYKVYNRLANKRLLELDKYIKKHKINTNNKSWLKNETHRVNIQLLLAKISRYREKVAELVDNARRNQISFQERGTPQDIILRVGKKRPLEETRTAENIMETPLKKRQIVQWKGESGWEYPEDCITPKERKKFRKKFKRELKRKNKDYSLNYNIKETDYIEYPPWITTDKQKHSYFMSMRRAKFNTPT